jgi:RNA polymerase sigma-70 factor, ECF subfamily
MASGGGKGYNCAMSSGRTNDQWLADLQGPQPEAALADLRTLLVRGLRFVVLPRLDGRGGEDLIEDFAQESLLKIRHKLHTFRGESQFTTWAQKVAVRVAFTELRRKRWQDRSLEEMTISAEGDPINPLLLADDAPSPEEQASQKAMLTLLHRILDEELTPRQREVLERLMVNGEPIEEVVVAMETNRNALYKLVHDARLRLRRGLANHQLTPDEVLGVFG